MMEDLFNVDLDLNLDLGVDNSNNLDFLPEDLFNFIGEDLKEIAENDEIPNIESLINFDEDDQLVDDEIQWDFDLDTTDFLFENIQQQQQQQVKLDQTNSESNFNSNFNSNHNLNHNLTKSISKPKQQKNKQSQQTQQQNFDENVASPASTINSSPNSPLTGYTTESNSNDSTDFLDMFSTYYSLDSNNNLISHPISTLSVDELNKLTTTFNQQAYSSLIPSESTFDLSNNFGGFVNMQSALNLVNGASFETQNFKKPINKLTTVNSKTKKKSKGTSLLANKPKSYKTIKKEMLQKKSLLNNRLQMTNRFKINKIQQEPQLETTVEIITTTITEQQLSQFRSSYAQDHDYCLSISQFINSYNPST